MALFRLLVAPALLATAIVAAGGARHRVARPPARAEQAPAAPGRAVIAPAPPVRAGRDDATPRHARTPR